MELLVLQVMKGVVIEVDVMPIEGKYFIVDREAPHTVDNWVVGLSHPSLLIYLDGVWCNIHSCGKIEVEILGILLYFVENYGYNESLNNVYGK